MFMSLKLFLSSLFCMMCCVLPMKAQFRLDPIPAEQDTYTSESAPTTTHGGALQLITQSVPGARQDIYVKFYFAGITASATKVVSAKLRLYALSNTSDELYAHYVPNGWGEGKLSWSDREKHRISPEPTAIVKGTKKGDWIEFELAPYITRNSYWNVVVRTSGANPVAFASKESGPETAPQLVVTLNKKQPVIVVNDDNLPPYEGPKAQLPPLPEAPFSLEGHPTDPIRGIYYNYTNLARENGVEFADHDQLDGVWLSYSWKDLEPQRGKVSKQFLNKMKADADKWIRASAEAGYPGRKALLSVMMQGLVTQDTPEWIYRSNGGPCDRISVVLSQDGRPVSAYYAPVNWWKKQANADYLNEVEIMVKALAEKFDRDPNIAGVQVTIGHLGHITVSMNKYFAPKFLEKGWTPEAWLDFSERLMDIYLKYFKHKQLFIVAEDAILRDSKPGPGHKAHYGDLRDRVVAKAQERGIGVLFSALRPDTESYVKEGYIDMMKSFDKLASRGVVSIGVYDDWPLYDPYRLTQRPIDADYFIGSLRNGTGPVEGYYGRTCVTFMVTFSKEVWGSYRGKTMNSDYYRDDIRKAVMETRRKLLGK